MTRKKLLVIIACIILIAVTMTVVLLVCKKPTTEPNTPPPAENPTEQNPQTPTKPEVPTVTPSDDKEVVIFTVTYDYSGGKVDGEHIFSTQVELNKPFSLINPIRDARFVFEGWFDIDGKQFTNEQGNGLFNWNVKSDITLYAHWIEAFAFTPNVSGYTVHRGVEIDKLTEITIPSSYDDLPINAVGDFADCINLAEIYLPQTITAIISRAFYNCNKLTNIRFEQGNNLNSIGAYAFYLSGIEGFDIAESVTEIGVYAFGRSAVKSVIFKESNLTRIAESVFRDCEYLTEVIFEGGKITSIGEYAFANSGVQNIVLPPKLTDIDRSSFSGCTALRSVTLSSNYSGGVDAFIGLPLEEIKVPIDNLYYSDLGGVLFDKSGSSLIIYPAGRRDDTYIVPASVTKIGRGVFNNNVYLQTIDFAEECTIDSIEENTFSGCTSLVNITLPKSVKDIGARAFYNCTSLISVDLAEVIDIGDEAFMGCGSIKEIALPGSLRGLGSSSFADCIGLNEVIFANGSLTSLSSYVFSGCKGMETIEIPTSVTSIGFSAFSGCTSLKSIVIPTNVISIGKSAFYGCEGIESVIFDANSELSTIESETFSGCSSLIEICLPNGLKKIDWEAFKGCISLKGLTLPATLTSIGESAFEECASLYSIIIPGNVKTLPAYIFKNCLGLKKVIFRESKVTIIGDSAFEGCSALIEIDLPLSLTSIKTNAFSGCIQLSEIIIPSNVMNIERNALMGVENITVSPENSYIYIDGGMLYGKSKGVIATMLYAVSKVDGKLQIPNIMSIESNALLCNNEITEVIIPESIIEMGDSAFKDCINLTKVTFAPQCGLTKINKSTFEGCGSLSEITIPAGVTKIEAHAFRSCVSLKQIAFEHGNRLVSIDEGVFMDSGICKIDLPDSIQNIAMEAFSGCDKLIEIVLPEGLTAIEAGLFYGCVSLTNVTIPDNVVAIKSGAFDGCTSVANINIPSSVTTIESGAFNNWTYKQTINVPFEQDKLPLGWSNDWNIGCSANIVFA